MNLDEEQNGRDHCDNDDEAEEKGNGKAHLPEIPPSQELGSQNEQNMERPSPALYIETWQGPLPKAEDLALYDNVIPGLAGQIVSMADEQRRHRMWREQQDERRKNFALLSGFCTALTVVAAGAYAIHVGSALAGVAIISVGVGLLPVASLLKSKSN